MTTTTSILPDLSQLIDETMSFSFHYSILFYLSLCGIVYQVDVHGFVIKDDSSSVQLENRHKPPTFSNNSCCRSLRNNNCQSYATTIQHYDATSYGLFRNGKRCYKKIDTTHSSRRTIPVLNAAGSSTSIASSILGSNVQLSISMGLIHLLLGSLGTPVVAKAISTWYSTIDKPAWTPPNRIFAPTWTLLYTFMGIAFSRVVQQLTINQLSVYKHPLTLVWMGHVLLNIIWAPIFFGLQKLRTGLYINYGLLSSLCVIIIPWYAKIDTVATFMVVPYALWLLYATCLNRSICVRNPGQYNTARFYTDLSKLQKQAAKYANS